MPTNPRRGKKRNPKPVRRSHPLFVLPLEDRSVPAPLTTSHPSHDDGGLDTMPPSVSFVQPAGFLTGPQAGDRDTVARNTLAAFAGKAGLTAADVASAVVSDSYTSLDQSHVYFRQQLNGLPILNANASVHLTADGRAYVVNAAFVPNLAAVGPGVVADVVGPAGAIQSAASYFGYPLTTPPTLLTSEGGERHAAVFEEPEFSDLSIHVERSYLNTPRGIRPVWELVARTPDGNHWYHAAVDTQDGAVEFWADWMESFDTYNVLPTPNESPSEGGRAVLVNPADPVASPFGWHDTNGVAGAEFTDTRGNNVSAQEDADDNDSGGARPSGGPNLIFDNPFDTTQQPASYVSAATTNLFYFNNVMHDVTYKFGFDEVSGNFQTKNYTGAGLGNDAVQADAQDGSGTNNANFGTPVDGQAPRMQMYRWTSTNPNRDSDFDNGIIAHEYGHGISNRLTGGPGNSSALNSTQSGGMGEGWSDFFALMLTQRPTDQPNDSYGIGTYVIGQPTTGTGIRSFPYSFSMAVNPMTFANYGTGAGQSTAVHFAGARWCSALWDMNWLLINKYGFDPDLNTGYAPGGGPASAGNKLTLRLVLDGMKSQAVNPSFIQARDAILAADTALTGGQNLRELWTAFARRGLGFSATTASSSDSNITEAFDLPPAFAAAPGITGQSPASVTATAPSSLTLTFSEAMNTSSFSVAADVANFTGPGGTNLLPAISGFAWTTSTTLRIDFTAQSAQGLYTLVLGPNITANDNGAAMDQDFDGTPGEATQDRYTANFRYDPVTLSVTAITPLSGAAVPVSTTTVDVTFSEAVLASSLTAADLNLSQGTVTGVTLLSSTQARFTVTGFTTIGEAQIFLSLKYGAVTDAAGFPSLAFNSSFTLDYTTVAFPTPLSAANPLGSLVYDGTFPLATLIGNGTDTDSFTLTLDANQRLAAVVTPAAGTTLRPVIDIFDPLGTNIGTVTGSTAGAPIPLSAAVAAAGTYTVRVASAGSTIGAYSLRLLLNAAGEPEQFGLGGNDTVATAVSLGPLFTTPVTGVTVASVIGQTDPTGKLAAEVEPNDTTGAANDASKNFAAGGTTVYHLGWTGNIAAASNQDWVRIGALDVGDIVTVTMSASGSGAGTLTDPFLELWRSGSATLVASSDDDGPGTDSIIYRFTVATADTYFVNARPFNAGTGTGTYRVGVRLENAGTAPTTGGAFTAETEANDTLATANDGSTSWRQVQNLAATTGSISSGDTDVFRYTFTAGDRITVRAVGAGGLGPNVSLLNSAGTVLQSVDNSTAAESSLYGFNITATGTYYVRIQSAAGTGTYTLNVFQSGTAPPVSANSTDLYALPLTAGQAVSVGLLRTTAGAAGIELLDPTGVTVLASGVAGTNYTQTLDAVVASTGTYLVRVTDTSPTAYQLTVTRGATLDREANNSTGTAQSLAFGNQVLGGLTAGDSDWFAVTVPAGSPTVRFRTLTPGDATGEFVNALNPVIEVYNPAGTLIATDDNSGGDGRNAQVTIGSVAAGTYRVRVLTSGGTTGEFILVTEVVPNLPPTGVSAGGPYSIPEGGTLALTATATDPEGDALTYTWDVNNDGTFGDATGKTPTLTWAALQALGLGDGPFATTVRVRVSDGNNPAVDSTGVALTITNAPPTGTAGNTGPTTEGSATPTTVSVTGASDPSVGDTAAGFTYSYDFDNDGTFDVVGVKASTATVPAALLADGTTTRTVRIAVIDRDGGSKDLFTTITVNGVGPTGTLTGGGKVAEGSAGSVTVSGVTDPSVADTAAGFRYSFDFDNDNSFDLGTGTYAGSVTTATVTVPASFLADGPFTRTVRVRIFDKDGDFSDTTTTIDVTNVNPTATLTGGNAVEGSTGTVSFGTVTDPSVADATAGFRYSYDFDNDGTFDLGGLTYATAVAGNSATVPASYLADGPFTRTVAARVYDRDGGFTDTTATIVVTNANPTTTLSNGGTVVEGKTGTVTFGAVTDLSAADVAAGFTYSYDFDNDGTFDLGGDTYATAVAANSATVPATFLDDGPTARTVRARVYDRDGGFTDVTTSITVTNAVPRAKLTGSGPVAEGGTATVTFVNQTDPSASDLASLKYAFDFDNDGTWDLGAAGYAGSVSSASVTIPTNLLADGPGDRVIRGRVIDKDGGFTDWTATVSVTNASPTATFGGGGPTPEGSPGLVTFTNPTDPSTDDTAAGFRYAYDFDNDGKFEVGGTSYSSSVPDAAVPVPVAYMIDSGIRTVHARIYDRDGGFTDYTTDLTITNVEPTATLTSGGPAVEGTSGSVVFSAILDPSASDLATMRFAYDFDNDGTFDLGGPTWATAVTTPVVVVPASFLADGPFNRVVRGRIIDVDGGFTDWTATVQVTNADPVAGLTNTGPVAEGTPTTITATAADVAADLLAPRYAFDLDNDGTFDVGGNSYATAVANPTTTVPAAADSGPRLVRVRVYDKDGGFADALTTVTVTNVAPTGTLTSGGPVAEGSAGSVSFSGVTDPSTADTAAGFTYSFDFDNDGTFDVTGSDPTVVVPAAFLANGPFDRIVIGRVADKDGDFTDYTVTIPVTNVAPTATFAGGGSVAEGTAGSVSFTGVVDVAADAAAGFVYSFDFDNDGTFDAVSTDPNAVVPATLLANGPSDRIVRGRVTDRDGALTEYTTTISVTNTAPTATFAADGAVSVGRPTVVRFTNVLDVAADLAAGLKYDFDFVVGGKTTTVSGVSPVAQFVFPNAGTFTVRGRVTDRDGGVSELTTTVTVTNVAPTATLTGATTTEGGTATVAFSAASHPSLAAGAAGFRYSFDFDNDGKFDLGDGTYAGSVTTATASVPAVLLADGGTRTVRGRVVEVNGGFADFTASVAVANVAPTATLSVPTTPVATGTPMTISFADPSDPSTTDTKAGFLYSFDTNNDGTFDVVNSPTPSVSVSFPAAGTYTVVGRIIDKDGGFTEKTATVTVVPPGAVPLPPGVTPTSTPRGYAVGSDAGGQPRAVLFDAGGKELFNGLVFDSGFAGGVRVAAGDVNGDGVTDLVVGTGPGRATLVRVLSGADGSELFAVAPFEASFTGGVYVAVGDLDGDGKADLAVTPDEGGGPRVDVYSGNGFGKFASYFGIDDPNFRGGARAATGDLNGDGRADLIVVAGFGGGPRVAAFDGRTVSSTPTRLFGDFFVFEQTLRNGIFVTAGDLDGDGFADLIAGGGPGGGPRVFALSGKGLMNGQQVQVANFFAGDADSRGGVRLVAGDFDRDGRADLIAGSGAGAGSRVTRYLGATIPSDGQPPVDADGDLFPGFSGGVFVG